MRETDEIDVMIRRYIKEVVSKHGVLVSTILLEIAVLLQVLIMRFRCLGVCGWI